MERLLPPLNCYCLTHVQNTLLSLSFKKNTSAATKANFTFLDYVSDTNQIYDTKPLCLEAKPSASKFISIFD